MKHTTGNSIQIYLTILNFYMYFSVVFSYLMIITILVYAFEMDIFSLLSKCNIFQFSEKITPKKKKNLIKKSVGYKNVKTGCFI